MESLPFWKDNHTKFIYHRVKKQFSHELYYGKEYKLELKVNEQDQARFDILWKKPQSLKWFVEMIDA